MSAPPTGVLFYDGRAKPLSTTGTIQPGAYYQFYLTGTLTLTNVYADGLLTTPLSQTPGTGATTAASDGRLVPIYLNPATTYRYQLYSSVGVLLEDIDPVVPSVAGTPTQTQIGQALYPITAAETISGLVAANLTQTYPTGNALRYGVDPTGVADSTTAIQAWINATWAMYQYSDGQGLWSGGGGADPVLILPPGKFKVSGTMYLPSGCTLSGTGHPAHTVNHTRIIMNSTGVNPPVSWTAGKAWDLGDVIIPSTPNGFWYFCTVGGTGAGSPPAFPTIVGNTVADGGATWQNFGATGGVDNRNLPMFKFRRGTLNGVGPGTGAGQGGTLQNGGCTSSIQNMEFWFVTLNSTFSNPLSGAACNQRSYPNGATIGMDVDFTDTRIIDCVFQNSSASLWASGVNSASATRGDGFTGNRGINIFVENCEFDAAGAHIWASNCFLDVHFKSCQFFNSPQYVYGCSGHVTYLGCYFQFGEILDYGVGVSTGGASPAVNTMTEVSILGCEIEPPQNYYFLQASGVNLVNVTGNTALYPATHGGIYVQNAIGGSISSNAFDSQGANVPAGSAFSDYHAVIKLDGCKNMLVSGNAMTSSFAATYGGFGILTGTSSGTTSTNNFVNNNSITTAFSGATFNNQPRGLNLQSTDQAGTNYVKNNWLVSKRGGSADTRVAVTYSASMTFDASQGTAFEITFTNTSAYTLNAPTNPSDGQQISIQFINSSGGSIGAATFNAVFHLEGSVAPAPNNGGNITIGFKYNGSVWHEQWRTAGSVSN